MSDIGYLYMSCICTDYENASRNEILRIAVCDDSGKALFDCLIKPAKRKRWDSYSHGITPESVRNAPQLSDVAPELQKLVKGRHVVLYNRKSLTRFLKPVLCTAASVHCCMLAYAEYKHDWDPYHKQFRWHKLDDAYEAISGKYGNINDCQMAVIEIMTVWQHLMTVSGIRRKYGFIPFSEQAKSWFKRILIIICLVILVFAVCAFIAR